MNYQDVLNEMKNKLIERECADIWLTENTANALVRQADRVMFEDDKLVMFFPNNTYVSVMRDGKLCGTVDAYWMISHFDEYNYNPNVPSKEKGVIIL